MNTLKTIQTVLLQTVPSSLTYTKKAKLNKGGSRVFLLNSETLIIIHKIIEDVI